MARRSPRPAKTTASPTGDVRAELLSLVAGGRRDEVLALFDATASERDAAKSERDAAKSERDAAESERDAAESERDALQTKSDRLQVQVEQLTRMLFGRRTERLSAEDLAQLTLAFHGTEEQAAAQDPDVPHPPPPTEQAEADDGDAKKKKKRNHPGRTKLSPLIERRVTDVPVPEGERVCTCCGEEMGVIGHVEHECVQYEPAKFVVDVERREKRGCQNCRGDAVTAERQQAPAVARRVGSSLLAHLIESKCDDALPIYRQRDQFKRLGFEVPQNTLYGYFTYATDLLMPVAQVTHSVVLGDEVYVALDDTGLRVLDRRRKGGSYRGHLWCFTGSGPLVAYDFTESWQADEIMPWIAAIGDGTFIQCDDYKGYSASVRWPGGGERILVRPERRLGCSMHVRRRFFNALKAGDSRATEPIGHWKSLYKLEALAKEQGLDAVGRGALRAERSIPVLDSFDAWVDAHDGVVVPSTPLGKAVRYAKHQRPFIRRCFSDGRFEIDNGHTERTIKEPAIGRKNFLFTGSADAAKRLAGAYTLVQSCRSLGIDTRAYLIDLIDKLEAGWPLRRLRELVPDRWAQLHAGAARK